CRRTAVGYRLVVARSVANEAGGESQNSGDGQCRRARLQSADEQRPRVLDCAPAPTRAEQADRLADGESLDSQRREQPVLLWPGERLVPAVAQRTIAHRDDGRYCGWK